MATQGATVAAKNLPQSTVQTTGPFVRQAIKSSRVGFSHAAIQFGSSATDPLPQTPGFARGLNLLINATGGAAGTATVTAITTDAQDDIVATAVQFLLFRDPVGTPILIGSGYSLLRLAELYGGQYGLFAAADLTGLTGETAVATGAGSSGNFGGYRYIPFEGTKGYGVIAMGNSSALPTLQVNFAGSASVYSTAPGTVPTLTEGVDIDYYAVANPGIEAPGNGTTFQWTEVPSNPTIASGASQRVQLPRTAGWLHTLILVCRDANQLRVAGYGTRVRLYVDNQLIEDEDLNIRLRKMQILTAKGFTRPTGVLVYSWRDSLSQVGLGLLDSLETAVPITPGSLIEVECTPWGTIATGPAILTAVYGQLVPRGTVQRGLPEA